MGELAAKLSERVNGLRASKTVNGETTTYQYVGDQLLYENRNGTDIYYFYDSYGTPTAIRYYKADGTSYRFFLATNQLGDVIGLYNANGTLAVKYEYDVWGNILSTTDADGDALNSLSQEWSDINPFRYRGYYYDAETELYYLQSRYYDAEVGRFLNSDVLLDNRNVVGVNTFAYCLNNPNMYIDYSGALCAIHAGGGGMPTNNNSSNNMLDTATAAYIQRTNMEIDMYYTQYEMIKEVIEYCFYINLQATLYQSQQATAQAELVEDFITDRFSTPKKAANTTAFVGSGIGLYSSASSLYAAVISGSSLGGPVSGLVSMVVIFASSILAIIAEEE